MKHSPPALVLPITGMTCRSCELLLEEAIGNVPGVSKVIVKRSKNRALVWGSDIHEASLEKAVEETGYAVGHEQLPWLTRDANVYLTVVGATALLAAIVLTLYMLGVPMPNVAVSGAPSATLALLVGLTAGFSTCMALIGGIVLAVSARFSQAHAELSTWKKFEPHLAFNGGRIAGFAILGGALGAFGSLLGPSERTVAVLTGVVGVVMLLLGVKITHISPRLAQWTPTLPSFLQWKGTKPSEERGPFLGAATSGALSFFLPCGFTLTMQLAALNSGSAGTGAIIMAAFALGTAPGLLGIGGLASAARGAFARVFFAAAGVLVLALGIYNIRGAADILVPRRQTGIVITPQVPLDPNAPVEELRMTQDADGYSGNLVVHAGSRVRWIIDSANSYTCASSIRVPALGLSKNLEPGENVIEFIATEAGTIPFSCSMGMYRGSITVLPKT